MDLKGAEIRNIFDLCMEIGGKNKEPLRVNIPYYQRPYRWDKTKIQNLIRDYYKNKKEDKNSEYFVGSVVLVKNSDKNNSLDIIDGQQRVTTVFLINYLRFLLQRSYIEELINTKNPNLDAPLGLLVDIYNDLLGSSHSNDLKELKDSIIEKMDTLSEKTEEERELLYEEIEKLYQKELYLLERNLDDEKAYYDNSENGLNDFLENDCLGLSYSRDSFNTNLIKALSKVCVLVSKSKSPILHINKLDDDNPSLIQYTNAIEYAWLELLDTVKMNETNHLKNAKKLIDYISDMIYNIRFCVIVTGNDRDAYTLFEVLNDRAMDIEDLELVKNLFLKTYCNMSGDDEHLIDKRIGELDELWMEDIFTNDLPKTRTKLISYLGTEYFTADDSVFLNQNEKYRSTIEKNYLEECIYKKNAKYTFKRAKNDICVYQMIRTIFEEYNLVVTTSNAMANCIKAENNSQVSITYKTMHLLNALKLDGVMPALTNYIIKKFFEKMEKESKEIDIAKFKTYIAAIRDDYKHKDNDEEYKDIHLLSFKLWQASLLSKNFETPRNIAVKIVKKAYINEWDPIEITKVIDTDTAKKLHEQFNNWTKDWKYGKSWYEDLKLKVLFIYLFKTKLNKDDNELFFDKTVYSFTTEKLQLDHLEAKNPDESAIEKYYEPKDEHEERLTYVNAIGNFMILDDEDNNNKNNKPLYEAIHYYEKMCKDHWMITEIRDFLNENHSEVKVGEKVCLVPNEQFFKKRAARLINYFEKLVSRDDLYSNKISLK